MEIPRRLILRDFAYLLDGGTTELRGTDDAGQPHVVTVKQHLIPHQANAGRLLFDAKPIEPRSDEETKVLGLLREAEIQCDDSPAPGIGPNTAVFGDDIKAVLNRSDAENIRALAADITRFVESDAYLGFAGEVAKAHHPTLFTVRAVNDPERRTQVIVGLGRALNLGAIKARERLDDGGVIGTRVTAPKVTELAERCASEGVAVRAEPEFPWPLPEVASP